MVTQARRQPLASFAALAFVALFATGCSTRTREVSSASASHEVLPFIHDDYPRALAEAKKRNKPLFVDAWAPWCHSCQSLRTYVLTDPSLAPLKDEFVWLSVDTEKDVNAKWVEQYPHAALPTLWLIDPATDRPLLKWAGTATAAELKSLLIASTSNDPATAAFVTGNHALANGDSKGAIEQHRLALASSPHNARIVEALVTELALSKDDAGCAEVAAAEAPMMAPGTSRASVLVAGLGCAREAKKAPERDRLLALAIHDATERDDTILPDDRSAIYEEVLATKKDANEDTKALATDWVTFLEGEAKRATSKDARTSLDPWRVASYIAVGEPARAIPVLEESARDFPRDYNPYARLGRIYLVLKRLDEAEKAADRAITLVYGPRAMRVYELRADIAKARGDRAGEIRALDEALAKSEHAILTTGQRGVRDGIAKRRDAMR